MIRFLTIEDGSVSKMRKAIEGRGPPPVCIVLKIQWRGARHWRMFLGSIFLPYSLTTLVMTAM